MREPCLPPAVCDPVPCDSAAARLPTNLRHFRPRSERRADKEDDFAKSVLRFLRPCEARVQHFVTTFIVALSVGPNVNLRLNLCAVMLSAWVAVKKPLS